MCYEKCPNGTITDSSNFICTKAPECHVENCEACSPGNDKVCSRCKRGTYMSNGICVNSCPQGFRADRITWSCLEPPVFAWYWVYPSRSSCKNYCGVIVQDDSDCSCASDCFMLGNCCQDIENHCTELLFWRKKAVTPTAPSSNKSQPKKTNENSTNSKVSQNNKKTDVAKKKLRVTSNSQPNK